MEVNLFKRLLFLILILSLILYFTGCEKKVSNELVRTKTTQLNKVYSEDLFKSRVMSVSKDNSKKCEVLSNINTAQRDLALTFDGMGDENTIRQILDELDKYKIKSIFFLPGMRVAEEPEIAQEIIRRGHSIGNNTLNRINLTDSDYETIYKEIKLSHDIITEKTGVSPKYVRTRFGYYNENVQYAAAQCGYEALVTYSINPQDWDMKTAESIAEIVERKLCKGSVIILNTDKNNEVVRAISLIDKIAEEASFKFVSLEQMISDRLPEFDYNKEGEALKGNNIANVISYVYTIKPEMALTFDGMADKTVMMNILDQLDRYKIKSTFFITGVRMAENPEIAQEILKRGHSIENNTFDKVDLTQLTFEQVYKDLKQSHEIIMKKLGVSPKYIRPKYGKYNETVLLAAAQCGYKSIITYTINPQQNDMKNAQSIYEIVKKGISRGRIISLNTENNNVLPEAIPLIVQAVSQAGQRLVSLDELLSGQYEKLPVDRIPGYYDAKENPDYEKAVYNQISNGAKDKKRVALTFDDWSNDYYLTKLLEVLRTNNIKSTFFLRGNGVEHNPNLAKLILEEGHEIANHSYSHQVSTNITPEELQKDIVKCHQVLSQALGQAPKMYFRPPTGTVDDISSKAIAATGYKTIIMYDVSSQDWRPEKGTEDIIRETIDNTSPGSIILLHLHDDMKTAQALDTIIKQLKNKGYEIVTVSELLQ